MYYWQPQYQRHHQAAEEHVHELEEQARQQRYDPQDALRRSRPGPLTVLLSFVVLLLLIFIGTTVFMLVH